MSTFSQKPKQPRRNWLELKEDVPTNILELPEDLTLNIFHRVGTCDILQNVQKVCSTWRKICKDPATWRVIYFDNAQDQNHKAILQEMCEHAVDRSQGQLIDITLGNFCDDDLLLYIAERSCRLRRLQINHCYRELIFSWTEALKKFPLLEELSLNATCLPNEAIVTAASYCPLLRVLKVNQELCGVLLDVNEEPRVLQDKMAIAIGKNLQQLEHLELVGDDMTNIGLQAILEGCRRLKSANLRKCLYINMDGGLGETFSQQIQCLKRFVFVLRHFCFWEK